MEKKIDTAAGLLMHTLVVNTDCTRNLFPVKVQYSAVGGRKRIRKLSA